MNPNTATPYANDIDDAAIVRALNNTEDILAACLIRLQNAAELKPQAAYDLELTKTEEQRRRRITYWINDSSRDKSNLERTDFT